MSSLFISRAQTDKYQQICLFFFLIIHKSKTVFCIEFNPNLTKNKQYFFIFGLANQVDQFLNINTGKGLKPRHEQIARDLKFSHSQAKIDENFANYFLKTKTKNSAKMYMQKATEKHK